jgi:hypothetical protein
MKRFAGAKTGGEHDEDNAKARAASFKAMWKEFDTNGSGVLEVKELRMFLMTMNDDAEVPVADAEFVIDCSGTAGVGFSKPTIHPDDLAAAVHVWTTVCQDGGVWVGATFDRCAVTRATLSTTVRHCATVPHSWSAGTMWTGQAHWRSASSSVSSLT